MKGKRIFERFGFNIEKQIKSSTGGGRSGSGTARCY